MQAEQHAGVKGSAGEDGGRVGGKMNGGKGPGANNEHGMNGLESADRAGEQQPNVAAQGDSQGIQDGLVAAVASAGDVYDGPEKGCLRFVASIRVAQTEDGDIRVKAFQVPGEGE